VKVPRIRFTTHRTLIVVAVIAASLGALMEYNRLKRLSRDYMGMVVQSRASDVCIRNGTMTYIFRDKPASTPPPNPQEADYYAGLAAKYERAARFPWLPVAPDQPEPE
jgi:hypothetical protein